MHTTNTNNTKNKKSEAYAAWRAEYADVPAPCMARALRCWHRLEAWLSQHAPSVAASLRLGATRAEVDEAEAEVLGDGAVEGGLPPAVRALYRYVACVCDAPPV